MSNPQETEIQLLQLCSQNIVSLESKLTELQAVDPQTDATVEEINILTSFITAFTYEINTDQRFQKTIATLQKSPNKSTSHHVHAMPGLCTTIKNLERESLTLLSTITKDSDTFLEVIKECTEKKMLAKKYTDDLTKAFTNSVMHV